MAVSKKQLWQSFGDTESGRMKQMLAKTGPTLGEMLTEFTSYDNVKLHPKIESVSMHFMNGNDK